MTELFKDLSGYSQFAHPITLVSCLSLSETKYLDI